MAMRDVQRRREIGALAEAVVHAAQRHGVTFGVAESLTGGEIASAIVSVPGASDVFRGGIVAYATPLKRSLLGVDGTLLDVEGPVHPEVARQMAEGARIACAVDGHPADFAIATTGVAGPASQGGRAGRARVRRGLARGAAVRPRTALRRRSAGDPARRDARRARRAPRRDRGRRPPPARPDLSD